MRTRTLATEAGDVTIREWGHETGEGDRLLLALHSMGPVSTKHRDFSPSNKSQLSR